MKTRFCVLALAVVLAWTTESRADDKPKPEAKPKAPAVAKVEPPRRAAPKLGTLEAVLKAAVEVNNLPGMLRPFVARCGHEKNYFRWLFCEALNERLKAQHQARTYHTTLEPSVAGPLLVKFRANPKPTMEITVRGCLTCKEPLLARKGGDVSKGRFFVFKPPKDIRIRRGKVLYDLGNIDIFKYKAELPKGTKEGKFKREILPHLRLQVVYKPVAGVITVGRRFRYGVINFELKGHRVFDKCSGKVYGAAPAMGGKLELDKNDLSCTQNQPKKPVVKVKLPSTLPQAKVKALMEQVGADLRVCYEQFGKAGDVPTDLVVTTKGVVKHVKVTGKLAGTETAACVERLIKVAKFPKFTGKDARLQWPFSLK